ncbi:uncharacterized protein [Antedon mediterranea]|uniref:uncharacterized protein n=1 Tax=Antedon mediterranea TaxID=105859 RepID=UPI003AF642B7
MLTSTQPMSICDHEEADSKMCIHIDDALKKGSRAILVCTVDTDVIVILVGIFCNLIACYPGTCIWVAFGMGKHFQYFNINTICHNLGEDKSRGLPVFHAFTGSDTTSQFFGKAKHSAWETWNSFPAVTEAFLFMAHHPFKSLGVNSSQFQLLEEFTCHLYDKTSTLRSVTKLRQDLFSRKARTMDNIPPTQDALLQHSNRSIYQASIWTTSLQPQQNAPSPEDFGWTKTGSTWTPVWTILPEASKACRELLKCGCKKLPFCSGNCKCCSAVHWSCYPCRGTCSSSSNSVPKCLFPDK